MTSPISILPAYPFDVFARPEVQARQFRLIVSRPGVVLPVAINTTGRHFLQLMADNDQRLSDEGGDAPKIMAGHELAEMPIFAHCYGPELVGGVLEYVTDAAMNDFDVALGAAGMEAPDSDPWPNSGSGSEAMRVLLALVRLELSSAYPQAKGVPPQDTPTGARRVLGLNDGALAVDYFGRVWQEHAAASDLGDEVFRQLATVERAVSGVRGIRSVLRADKDCRLWFEADADVEYTPLHVTVVGRLEQGLDALLEVADLGLEALRERDWSAAQGGGDHG